MTRSASFLGADLPPSQFRTVRSLSFAILKIARAAARHFSEANERIRSVSKVPLAPQPVTLKHSDSAW